MAAVLDGAALEFLLLFGAFVALIPVVSPSFSTKPSFRTVQAESLALGSGLHAHGGGNMLPANVSRSTYSELSHLPQGACPLLRGALATWVFLIVSS